MDPLLLDRPLAAATLLSGIRDAVARSPLPGLAPDAYARGHDAFEQRSDQRDLLADLLTDLLVARLAARPGPTAVLSVGCGDGTLDARLARALTRDDPTRAVRYVGVEPYAGSAASFTAALARVGAPGLDVGVHVATFDETPLSEQTERFDVIAFVHSMYYVADVPATLRAAHALLRPGGELLVLNAPRGALNELAAALAPPVDGHGQWFSDDVAAAFARAGLEPDVSSVDACLDLTDADADVLDFTVQATLDDTLRPLVLAYLTSTALPGDGLRVPHPVDVYRVEAPDSATA